MDEVRFDMDRNRLFRSFLKDIIDHPEADEPRLILADWIVDHAEREDDILLGELIRLQMDDPDFDPWISPRFRLWCSITTGWLGILFRKGRSGSPDLAGFDRGFVGRITCTYPQWVELGPALVRMAPITRLDITGAFPQEIRAKGKAMQKRANQESLQWARSVGDDVFRRSAWLVHERIGGKP